MNIVRAAIFVPPLVGAIAFVLIAASASSASGTGLAEDQRGVFFVVMPILYFLLSALVSSLYVSWLCGAAALPVWLRGALVGNRSRLDQEDSFTFARTLARPARLRFALGRFLEGCLFIFMMFPFPILVGFLFSPGVYRPWEAGVVLASLGAQAAWLIYLIRHALRRPTDVVPG